MRYLIIISLFIFTSCLEELAEDQQSQLGVPSIGMINYPVETLSAQEMELARNFCSALSEKEDTFPRRYFGATISFKVKKRECSEDKSELQEAIIKARLGSDSRSGNMRYFPMDFYLPLMTDIETVNQGTFSTFCPDLLLNVQKTNVIELEDGEVQIFRFIRDGNFQIMAQVLTSEGAESAVSRIRELSVVTSETENRPRGLAIRKIDLVQCGNQEGNEKASFWSQEI